MAIDLNGLLKLMVEKKGSDLHLRFGYIPVIRIDGRLTPEAGHPALSAADLESAGKQIMSDRQWKMFLEQSEADLAYNVPGTGRFRANAFRQRGNISYVFRHVPTVIPHYDELRLPAGVRKLAEFQRGLVLVTGTTGSGKSTTLAAMIDAINAARSAHILTIEDPIEFLHEDKQSIINQRELGLDTTDYHEALKHVLRQDPDVILVGEMRDLETMSAAITAAETGHLVLSTVHTIDAMQTITRIIDVFPSHQQNQIRLQLADVLKGVISQRLIPHASGIGRVPAVEVLVVTALVRKLILDADTSGIVDAIRKGEYYHMQTFNQSLVKLFNEGLVKLEDALEAATNPEELMLAIRGIESQAPSL